MPSLPLIKHTMAAAGASTARALMKQIRPHIPSIRFPKREPLSEMQARPIGNPNSIDALITKNVTSGQSAPASSGSTKAKGPSIDSSVVPTRFQRKPLSNEEIEYIEKGGPV